MKYSIIIAGYNEEKNIDLCLRSCLNLDYPKDNFEIIYVDNNSSDNSLEIASKYKEVKSIIEYLKGPSEARNTGIKNSTGEICLFLDADTIIAKNYLKIMDTVFKNESIAACGAKILPMKKTWISLFLGVSILERYPRMKYGSKVRNHPSCNLAVRRNILSKVGFFLESINVNEQLIHRSEDKELCNRINKYMKLIYYTPKTYIYHENRTTLIGLLNILLNSSEIREDLIYNKYKDFLTSFFKFHVPSITILICIILFILNISWGITMFFIVIVLLYTQSICYFFKNGLFFSSFFIKPWLDPLTLLLVDVSIIIRQIKRLYNK